MKEETKVFSLKDTWFRSGSYTFGPLAEEVKKNLGGEDNQEVQKIKWWRMGSTSS